MFPFITIHHYKCAQGTTWHSNTAKGLKGHFQGPFWSFVDPPKGVIEEATWVQKVFWNPLGPYFDPKTHFLGFFKGWEGW